MVSGESFPSIKQEDSEKSRAEMSGGLEPRHATRTVLFDQDGRVAIVNVKKHGYYKIPGGGVDDGETIQDAVRREVREESGCDCHIIGELGRVETEIPTWGMLDISDGFVAIVDGDKLQPNYDDYEEERDFEIKWFDNIDVAISTIEDNIVTEPGADVLQGRDLDFLKMAREVLEN